MLKQFKINFSDITKISNLFLTTRIKEYHKKQDNTLFSLSYFLSDEKFNLGQIKREDYETKGKFPVVDQSQDFIVGYSDENDLVYNGSLPTIIFGDHTRIFKYVDFPFIQGADGIKVLIPNSEKVNPKFFYYLLSKISVPSRGYNRHFSILKEQKYPNLPLSTQNEIVSKIELIDKKIKDLKSQIKEQKDVINLVFARDFGFDENIANEFGKGMTALTQSLQDRKLKVNTIKLDELVKSEIVRVSTRFHNEPTKKLMEFLDNLKTIEVNKIIDSYEKGVQPKYDTDGEIDVIKITNLKNGYIDFSETEKVSQEYYNSLKEEKYLKENDIIICATGKGSLGKIDLFEGENEAITSVDNYIIRVNQEKYNPLFFTYFFRSILGIFQIERDYTGATNQIHLYWEQIGNFKIPDISLPEQQKIVYEIKLELDKQELIKKDIEKERTKIDELIEVSIRGV